MSPISEASLTTASNAATTQNPVGLIMLKKALDNNASVVSQLIEGLPQRENVGTLVDFQA